MTKMMMKRNGTQTNGANPKGKNAEEPATEKAIAETARIPTTTARTRPVATVFGGGLRETGGGNHTTGRGEGWTTPPNSPGAKCRQQARPPRNRSSHPGARPEYQAQPL